MYKKIIFSCILILFATKGFSIEITGDPRSDVILILNEMQQALVRVSNDQYDGVDIDRSRNRLLFAVDINKTRYLVGTNLDDYLSNGIRETTIITVLHPSNTQLATQLFKYFSDGFDAFTSSVFRDISDNDMFSRTWIKGTSTYRMIFFRNDNSISIGQEINIS